MRRRGHFRDGGRTVTTTERSKATAIRCRQNTMEQPSLPPDESPPPADEPSSTTSTQQNDVSNAVAWARECSVNGSMRSWIDLPPLKLPTNCECDGMLWTASLILLRHLEVSLPNGWWRGKRVLELGTGTGHLAVGLARLGASVTATESNHEMAGGQAGYDSMVAWVNHLLVHAAAGAAGQPKSAQRDFRALFEAATCTGGLAASI